ncbi:Acyl-CoA N-acyltransferase [Pseudocohnilembus persalinus]|uniref:Acyl-CoA N-acyltransferase n=1 Tax=Pseudocohnilembus persalinus TaxID=266149 RepID=A0A0V0QNP9_PSEPJ|nr:Acyl-CoA N-acyltransferase [Pseudocohnilembus persalinus]|eukprot:KRX03890.1 Acyl-CoA N-acyltransferase [Pseudocohnilembus persalinus]
MATIKPFSLFDQLDYNNINLDICTETFGTHFYSKYISKWNEYCITMRNCTGRCQAYLLGKVEGDRDNDEKKNWHGHVTAITVEPDSRRQGIARFLMDYLEQVSEKFDSWYVDLFVRPSNNVAVGMYKMLGYEIYQVVNKYYCNQLGKEEDSYDMRKSLSRDVNKITSKPTGKTIEPSDLEFH